MSRRNILRPSIPTKSVNPARGRGADQQQQQQKKQKLSDEVPPPSASKTAGQAALKAYDRAVKVTAERERYRTDRDNFRAKFKISESQLQETDAEVEKLKKELAEAKTDAATADAEMEKMKMEEKKKVGEADAKGYEAGIKRAALEYTQTAHQMVNDELETRLPDFFKLGYAAGAEAMAGGPRQKRQKGVRLPKVGYTAEERLSPLGQEDFSEPSVPGFNVPLQIHEPTVEEMSRRNVPRPVIPTKTTNPARGRSASDQQQQQKDKRQRLSQDVPPPNTSQIVPPEIPRPSPPKDLDRRVESHVD
ncbi:hypothetical protein RHGRI_000187 [Rhododendron griersonianum]|uniref:Uncharacterized protein n=1 Tax=Rhododendron griersonianum TaxID=479676 RepID=A0AAV6LFL2_9ERIC|nr:hypothetical protein RHGRI_000187 [Rhododendron griersonianum]